MIGDLLGCDDGPDDVGVNDGVLVGTDREGINVGSNVGFD